MYEAIRYFDKYIYTGNCGPGIFNKFNASHQEAVKVLVASCLNEADDDIGCVITFCDAGSTKLGHNSMTKEVTTAIITTGWILLKDQKSNSQVQVRSVLQVSSKSVFVIISNNIYKLR